MPATPIVPHLARATTSVSTRREGVRCGQTSCRRWSLAAGTEHIPATGKRRWRVAALTACGSSRCAARRRKAVMGDHDKHASQGGSARSDAHDESARRVCAGSQSRCGTGRLVARAAAWCGTAPSPPRSKRPTRLRITAKRSATPRGMIATEGAVHFPMSAAYRARLNKTYGSEATVRMGSTVRVR
jgi:hypothetical protein